MLFPMNIAHPSLLGLMANRAITRPTPQISSPASIQTLRLLSGVSFLIGLFCALSVPTAAQAAIEVQGSSLFVTSQNLKVSFRGADVVGISNLATGETYLRSPTTSVLTNLVFYQGASASLTAGNWSLNTSTGTAALTLTGGTRTISITVGIDSANQEIFTRLSGQSTQGGVRQLSWGVTGFDLNLGRLVVPAMGGISFGAASFQTTPSYSVTTSNPLQHWEAPLSLFQTKLGGVAIFARDLNALYKGLTVATNGQQTVNQSFAVEAAGPWTTATQVGAVEWRIAAYSGGWQVGARIYRDWHNSVAPPVPLLGGRAWAKNVTTVVKVNYNPPYVASILDDLAKAVTPTQTLLYLVNWRSASFDVNYPDYTPHATTQELVNRAHQLGFHVMLHTDMIGVSPLNADYASVQQFQAKDASNLALLGWYWSLPATTPGRYGFIDPAASAYRRLFVTRLTAAIQALNADAVHLDIAGWPPNDGNGLIDGMNYNQGAAQLHQDLLAAFPNLVIGTEGTNDVIAPFGSFVQQIFWPETFSPETTPPVPISAYVLPNVVPYGHLALPNPDQGGYLTYFRQYEGQGVLPTYSTGFNTGTLANYARPEFARFMKLVSAFQQNGLQPDWDSAWNGAVIRYRGANGSSLSISDNGTLITAMLRQASTDTLLYQRVHNANQVNSSYTIPGWPAFSGTATTGIDPNQQFWFDATVLDLTLVRLTGLVPGIKLGLGTGTLVTPDFSYFTLAPTTTPDRFDFFQSLGLAKAGTTYARIDGDLINGAAVTVGPQIVGGVSRQSISTPVPYIGTGGGETFFEYSVAIPDAYGATLLFATGILDNAIPGRKGPMTFKVQINGATVWQQNVSTGAWVPASIDLGAYLGQSATIRFVANPGPVNDATFGRAVWSALQLAASAKSQTTTLNFTIPSGSPPVAIITDGAYGGFSNGSAVVTGCPLNSTAIVFTANPRAVALKQSLVDMPSRVSQSASGQLATVSTVQGAGIVGATTASGVNKPRTLQAFSPTDGQTILSWPLQLPASGALYLSFSVGLRDGTVVFPQGYLMSVRINGQTLWQYTVTQPVWKYGAVDLSPWSGQNALVELITDSQGPNTSPFVAWAELTIDNSPASTGATTLNSSGPISALPSGTSASIAISAPSDAPWSVLAGADWISVSGSSGTGNGTISYTVLPNFGPPRSTTFVVAGHLLPLSQAGISQTDTGRLINLSILTSLASGETMTMGTVLGGAGTSGPKPLVARAVGPSLAVFGVTGTLPDPKMALIAASTGATVANNNDWAGEPMLSNAFAQVGAFAYTSSSAKDAGIFQPSLTPGGYTVQIGDNTGGSGAVLAELYDATLGNSYTASAPRLINVSVLKYIATGSTLTTGFVIGGTTNAKVLLRAIGPTLGVAPFNIGGVMADPKLELFNNATGAKITENNDWGGNPTQSAAFTAVGAFALANAATKDAAMLVTVAPGQYSARVSANDGGSGIVIVEVYELP